MALSVSANMNFSGGGGRNGQNRSLDWLFSAAADLLEAQWAKQFKKTLEEVAASMAPVSANPGYTESVESLPSGYESREGKRPSHPALARLPEC